MLDPVEDPRIHEMRQLRGQDAVNGSISYVNSGQSEPISFGYSSNLTLLPQIGNSSANSNNTQSSPNGDNEIMHLPSSARDRFANAAKAAFQHASQVENDFAVPIRKGDESGMFQIGLQKPIGPVEFFVHDDDSAFMPYLNTSKHGILHMVRKWSRVSLLSDIAYRYSSGNAQSVAVPCLQHAICDVRKYKFKGVWVCPQCPVEFKAQTHCSVDPASATLPKSADVRSLDAGMMRRTEQLYHELIGRQQYCPLTILKRDGNCTSLVKCPGKPVVRKSNRPNIYGRNQFIGCSGYHLCPGGSSGNSRHFARKLTDLTDDSIQYLPRLLSGEEIPNASNEECNFILEKKKRCGKCEIHKCALLHLPCSQEMTVIQPFVENNSVPESRTPKDEEHITLYVACFGVHTHPPPPPPVHTIRKTQLLEQARQSNPGMKIHVLRKKMELQLVTNKHDNKSLGSSKISESSSRRLLKALCPKPSRWAGTMETFMNWVPDPGITYCRKIKIVKEVGIVVLALGRDETIMRASRCRYVAGDATFKTVMAETRRMGDSELYLYNIVCPAQKGGQTNAKGVVSFRAVTNGLSAQSYCTIWKAYLREVMASRARDLGVSDVCLSVPYIPIPQLW